MKWLYFKKYHNAISFDLDQIMSEIEFPEQYFVNS